MANLEVLINKPELQNKKAALIHSHVAMFVLIITAIHVQAGILLNIS